MISIKNILSKPMQLLSLHLNISSLHSIKVTSNSIYRESRNLSRESSIESNFRISPRSVLPDPSIAKVLVKLPANALFAIP
jgi:hypothetical protein